MSDTHNNAPPLVRHFRQILLWPLQVMHAKGLVERDDSQRAHVYRAAVSKERTQKRFLADMVQRVFDGSASQLVLHALGSQRATREELDEIRGLLDRLEREVP